MRTTNERHHPNAPAAGGLAAPKSPGLAPPAAGGLTPPKAPAPAAGGRQRRAQVPQKRRNLNKTIRSHFPFFYSIIFTIFLENNFIFDYVAIPNIRRAGGVMTSKFLKSPKSWLKIMKMIMDYKKNKPH